MRAGSERRPVPAVASRAAAMHTRPAFTIGYQGADPDELARELVGHGVSAVIDTRQHPTSRRPAFRKEALRARLAGYGVAYWSWPGLGAPRSIRSLAIKRRALFRIAYEASLRRHPEAIGSAIELSRRETIALLCFEVDPGECHRSILADAMTATASLDFTHLHVRRSDHANDEPVLPSMVRPDKKVEVASR